MPVAPGGPRLLYWLLPAHLPMEAMDHQATMESTGEHQATMEPHHHHHHHQEDDLGQAWGGFAGHTSSGLAFLLLGNWFAYNTCLEWWRAEAQGKEFHTRASFQQGWARPWETLVKVSVTLAYALGEVVTGCCDGGSFMNNAQHITMCALFLINGLADLLVFYRLPVPHNLQFLTGSFAFWGESFLFSNHSHGMSALFQHTHALLYLPSYMAAGIFFVEVVLPRVWLFPALRNLAISIHGSWLVQSAFILYSGQVGLQPWQEDSSLMVLPMLFAWHLIANLLLHTLWLYITKKRGGGGAKANTVYSRLEILLWDLNILIFNVS